MRRLLHFQSSTRKSQRCHLGPLIDFKTSLIDGLTIDCYFDDFAEPRADSVVCLTHVVAEIRVSGIKNIQRSILVNLKMRTANNRFLSNPTPVPIQFETRRVM